jgi:transposase
VERVNAYLKQYYQLNNVRYRTGKRSKVHFDLVTLVYNASKLSVDRIYALLNKNQPAALKTNILNSVGLCIFKKSNYDIDSI